MGYNQDMSVMLRNNMTPLIKFRLAKTCDAKALAALHYACLSMMEQPNAFTYIMGRKFLERYYRIILHNKSSIVLCAEAQNAGIVGLISASLEASDELEALKAGRFTLLLSSLPVLIRRPKLILSTFIRAKAIAHHEIADGLIIGPFARISFWGWSPDFYAKGQPLKLLQTAFKILKNLGAERVRLEVDRKNRKVEILHRLMGGKIIKQYVTHDGRERIFMEHML